MAECIDREALLKFLRKQAGEAHELAEEYGGESIIYADCLEDVLEDVERFPAADVAPVRHGRWQYNTDFYVWRCSECGENPTKGTGVVTTAEKLPAYCPNCGAKMDGAE